MATACRISSQFQLVLAAAIQLAYPTKRERSYPHNLDYKLPYSEKNCIHNPKYMWQIYIKNTLYGIRYLLLDYNKSVLTVLGMAF